MKTFLVKSTKTVRRETVVEANSAKEAKRLVKTGAGFTVDMSRKISNTVNSATELK